ncbi:MAG TPA: 2-oxoacid:ferredoxin oxidoreductase subunit beta [Dehalococcoidales bacterium]|nr:2-oxoacid:ferredoxin oxidoreductase subunit beta [Dehalococcoidales bacterium]
MREPVHFVHKYLRSSKRFPHIWCAGCGIGIFMQALIRVIDQIGYSKDEVVLISGIGCSGRLPVYVDFNTLHTTHGRALTFATGIKLANPRLKVITIMGDGDAIAIGGNHLIHAARRNVEIASFVINNQVYGMTGGQCSPTTPYGEETVSSPYGNLEPDFDICRVVEAAGAAFVARTTVYHTRLLDQLIAKALKKKGFSMVEVFCHCVTYSGRYLGLGSPVEMMEWLRDNSVPVAKARGLGEVALKGKIVTGVLVDREKPTYHEEYRKLQREKLKV